MVYCQICGCNTRLKEEKKKKNAFASQLQMGFPRFCCRFSASPCLYTWIHMVANTDVKRLSPRADCGDDFSFSTLFFSSPLSLRSCGANVLYIQMTWVTPVWACLDFILWYFLSFVLFFFSFLFSKFQWLIFWVLFWFASLRCFSKKGRRKKKNYTVLILSLVIADINYCYYLFLLFDLTFIVEYFSNTDKKDLCNFVHLKQSQLLCVVYCLFRLFTKRTEDLNVQFLCGICFGSLNATVGLKETTCSHLQKRRGTLAAYICFGICFQEVHHSFN